MGIKFFNIPAAFSGGDIKNSIIELKKYSGIITEKMILLKDGIIITQFNIDDLHQIYNLGLKEQSFMDSINPWTPENLSSLFASDNFTAFTARRKNKILGFIIGEKENSRTQILWFMVTPHLRKKGIGSALIDYFLKNSAGKSINELFIRINENNLDSINFLCKKGLTVNKTFIELSVEKSANNI